jgi:cysteine-dependent adenosine diphosphate thiazole synthase
MSPAQTYEPEVTTIASHKYDVSENYEGQYHFAPIEEAQVSRAMIKRYDLAVLREISPSLSSRYFNVMYERAVSDVVIVGAGSAGLSCAWQLATTRPEVCCWHCTPGYSEADQKTVEDNFD